MKLLQQGRLGLLALASASIPLISCDGEPCVSHRCDTVRPAQTDELTAMTHWLPRAQGQQLGIYAGVGVGDKINLFDQNCSSYGLFDLTLTYEKTAHNGRNASYFGNAQGLITLGTGTGSKMVDNDVIVGPGAGDYIYAYPVTSPGVNIRSADLGLSNDYTATYCIRPEIRNFVAQIDLWCGWDSLVTGLFTRVRAPLTWSRWTLGLTKAQESGPIDVTTGLSFAAGAPTFANFYTPGTLDLAFNTGTASTWNTQPLIDGDVAFAGQTIPISYAYQATPPKALVQQDSQFDIFNQGMACGPVPGIFGVADLPVDLGYNFILNDRGVLGVALHTVFPVGTRRDGDCLFSPRIGLGRWQLGALVDAQYTAWVCDNKSFTLYFNGFITHAFSCTEERLLGLKANNNYAFNDYLLLKKIITNTPTGIQITTEHAANLLYQPIRLSGFLNSDLALWAQYINGGFDFTVGYNFSGRESEGTIVNGTAVHRTGDTSFLIPVQNATFGDPAAIYVVKGDAPLYLVNALGTDNQPSPHAYDKANSNINTLGTLIPLGSTAPANGQTFTPANLAQLQSIAFTGADVIANPALHGSMISNAIFAYIGYTWPEHLHATPFIGLGAQYEFGVSNDAMNMWGTFLKGGIYF